MKVPQHQIERAKQADDHADAVARSVSLSFYLWAKHNGWTYSETKGEWFDGMVRLSHTQVFHQFMKYCQNVTHVEASENSSSIA
jgi:hypothetical protein